MVGVAALVAGGGGGWWRKLWFVRVAMVAGGGW